MTALTDLQQSERFVTFAILVVAVLFSTTGELFLKAGVEQVEGFALTPAALLRTFTTPAILVGFGLFGIGAIVWLLVLSRAELSWAYPMLALGYVLVVLESKLLFHEVVPPQRWLGALIVVAGVIVMYGSAPEQP